MSDTYFEINRDIWNLFKNAQPIGSTDAYWNKLLNDANAIEQRYSKTSACEYCRALLLATINEIDRLSKCGDFESFKKPDQAARKPLQRAEN